MTRQALMVFVRSRLDAMSQCPSVWSTSKESFILQLVLLAEISHLGTPEWFSDRLPAMLVELCGGNKFPVDEVTQEWARRTVDTTRKYVTP